jgi:hypothetical protein
MLGNPIEFQHQPELPVTGKLEELRLERQNSMLTLRPKQSILFLPICIALLCQNGHARQRPQKYEKSIFLGLTHIQTTDGCLTMGATVSATDFFTNLRKVQIDGTVEFRKASDVITSFPENMSVSLRASEFAFERNCRDKSAPVEALGASALMKSLQFQTFWQRGSETRPAIILSVKRVPNPLIFGSYILSVRSADVPLTDHLIVRILDGTGRNVVSFSAAL